jgi:hypothetical protein
MTTYDETLRDRNYKTDLYYNIQKSILMGLGYSEESAQLAFLEPKKSGIPTTVTQSIHKALSKWIINNASFSQV